MGIDAYKRFEQTPDPQQRKFLAKSLLNFLGPSGIIPEGEKLSENFAISCRDVPNCLPFVVGEKYDMKSSREFNFVYVLGILSPSDKLIVLGRRNNPKILSRKKLDVTGMVGERYKER